MSPHFQFIDGVLYDYSIDHIFLKKSMWFLIFFYIYAH